MRYSSLIGLAILSFSHATAPAQSPAVLYTWNGTGNTHDWAASGDNFATLNNGTAGQLTVTEMGDELDPSIVGGPLVIRDGFNRRLESSTAQGGLDLTGLEFIEVDLQHNGAGNVNVQFFVQATPSFTYLWGGSDGLLGRSSVYNAPDWALGPGLNTLRFPINLLSPNEQAYIRTIGLSVRDHSALGNLTWDIFEVRSTGTPLAVRDLATHDVGTSDNGLQGAFANFELAAIVGNDGGQNQSGLSHNAASGSLQWTDKGTGGVPSVVSGAAIAWGNGTLFDGNSFNERLSDFSNYDTVTFRVSATDPLGAGGQLGIQSYFQTGSFVYQVAGETNLPIDGQFHDLVFSLNAVNDRVNTQFFGLNLFTHTNDLVINVDLVRFKEVVGIPGDYNGDGKVDAADYALWRDSPNDFGGAQGYTEWVSNFGNMQSGAGSGVESVPEPRGLMLVSLVFASLAFYRWRS